MPGALEGIGVVEFSELVAAPLAWMPLGDMGADVIKVEPPQGRAGSFDRPLLDGREPSVRTRRSRGRSGSRPPQSPTWSGSGSSEAVIGRHRLMTVRRCLTAKRRRPDS